jgi:cystathionine beta-lyase/cystathionine gamma-synthase
MCMHACEFETSLHDIDIHHVAHPSKLIPKKAYQHIVRLHIGLEDPKDLINDLKRSLRYIK